MQSLGNHEYAFICRFSEGFLDVRHLQFFVAHKAVSPLAYHPEAFLNSFFEGAADSHHLAYGFHRRTDFAGNPVEFAQIPARNLAHYVIQRRLEECRSRHEGKRIAGSLGGQGGRTAETGINLNHPVVHGIRIIGKLYVAFANDSDMTDNLYGKFAQIIVILVRKRLRRGDHDALAGMYAQRVEVLHVADSDAIVVFVSDHLIFNLLPALQ